jgi:hypothetical protein
MPARQGVNDVDTPYPVVDADPHFGRVMSYMRPSEYALWAAGTAAFPAAIYGLGALAFISQPPSRACALAGLTKGCVLCPELADPSRLGPRGLRPTLKIATWLGFAGGFLLAYQTTSCARTQTRARVSPY